MDFTRVILHESLSNSRLGFDVRAFFKAGHPEDQPIAMFFSAQRLNPDSKGLLSVKSELTLEDSKLARGGIRQQGASQGFFALFVYVSSSNNKQLAHTLQQLADDGEEDIVVIAQDELASFLPVLGLRSSLVAAPQGAYRI